MEIEKGLSEKKNKVVQLRLCKAALQADLGLPWGTSERMSE